MQYAGDKSTRDCEMNKSTKQLASAHAYERIASTEPARISGMNPQTMMSRVGHEVNEEGSKIVLIPPEYYHPATIRFLIGRESATASLVRHSRHKSIPRAEESELNTRFACWALFVLLCNFFSGGK